VVGVSDSAPEQAEDTRVQWRVGDRVQEAFENAILENYGVRCRYRETELDRLLRAELSIGTPGTLVDAVHSLARTHEEVDREKEIPPVPERSDGPSPRLRYRLPNDLAEQVRGAVARSDNYDNPGEFAERIMWRYAEGDGYEARAADRAGRVEDATRALTSDTDAVERRTETIIAAVDLDDSGRTSFTREEFREGVAAARGISTETGKLGETEQKYLDRVQDQLSGNWGWIRGHTFGDLDQHNPGPLTNKPFEYLTDDERVPVIRRAALERARSTTTNSGGYKFDKSEVRAALDNRPTGVAGEMQTVADRFDGFRYDPDETVLKVNPSAAAPVDETNRKNDFRGTGTGSTVETTTPDGDLMDEPDSAAPANTATDDGSDGWIQDVFDEFNTDAEIVADELPDNAIRAKIARYRRGEGDDGYAKGIEKVPDSDVQAVRDHATEDTEDLEADAKAEVDAPSRGIPANATTATDGGSDTDVGDGDTPALGSDGGTATVDPSGSALLERRSLGPVPNCPRCGGRLQKTADAGTVECVRSRCGRRVSLVDAVEQIPDRTTSGGGPPTEPGD
jgi:hypothetical protein